MNYNNLLDNPSNEPETTGTSRFGNLLRAKTNQLFKKIASATTLNQENRINANETDGTYKPNTPWTEIAYHLCQVHIPLGSNENGMFFVALPGGKCVEIEIARGLFAGGPEKVDIPYDPLELNKMNKHNLMDEKKLKELPATEDKLLELYKCHDPSEHEAVVFKSDYGIGIYVFDGPFGVHVHAASFPGPKDAILSDDIITSINGVPVSTKQELETYLSSVPVGDVVVLSLLRKSPPLAQRCPAGHIMGNVARNRLLQRGSVCNRCGIDIWKDCLTAHTCYECDWSLCDECYSAVYENLNSSEIANNPLPSWSSEYEEGPFGLELTNSAGDIGTKLRIFWQSTGEWWLGEITDWAAETGHVVVYEEGADENKKLSKERIQDMSTKTYRVLVHRDGTKTSNVKAPEISDSTSVVKTQVGSNEEAVNNQVMLTEDEQQLLKEIQSKYG